MEDNKELVTDVTENVDDLTTEELVDGAVESEGQEPVQNTEPVAETFTKEQVDEMIAKKLARKEAKIRKEYDKKYGRLTDVLKAGTGEEDVETLTNTFADFYTKKGIQIPTTPQYSQREMEILADAEANDIINSGYEEIKEEVDRLANIGVDNMTPQEKLIFSRLAQERTRIEDTKELASIGVTEVDDDFKEFAKKFSSDVSLKEKYEMYSKLNPKAKGTKMGSMKSNTMKDNGVKEFYTYDEAIKFTKADFDKNPELYKAVENSMSKW
jgi:hypothetical protein